MADGQPSMVADDGRWLMASRGLIAALWKLIVCAIRTSKLGTIASGATWYTDHTSHDILVYIYIYVYIYISMVPSEKGSPYMYICIYAYIYICNENQFFCF